MKNQNNIGKVNIRKEVIDLRVKKFDISYFVCPECGKMLPLPRPRSCKRNKGHNKDLFCVYCGKVVKTTEIRKGDVYVKDNGEVIYC